MPTQKNLASWNLQLGFNLAFKRLNIITCQNREITIRVLSKGDMLFSDVIAAEISWKGR